MLSPLGKELSEFKWNFLNWKQVLWINNVFISFLCLDLYLLNRLTIYNIISFYRSSYPANFGVKDHRQDGYGFRKKTKIKICRTVNWVPLSYNIYFLVEFRYFYLRTTSIKISTIYLLKYFTKRVHIFKSKLSYTSMSI